MTASPTRCPTMVVAATVFTLALTMGGCGSGSGGELSTPTAPSAPAATGTGPYPTPSAPRAATPAFGGSNGIPRIGVTRPGDLDQNDADAVSRGALTTLWAFDTTVDRQPHDAALRAANAGWLTQAYATQLRVHQPLSVPGAQWQEWAGHRATTTVSLARTEDAGKPADTSTEAWRQWTVTVTPSGRDKWAGEPLSFVAYVHLTRTATPKGWRVAGITVP